MEILSHTFTKIEVQDVQIGMQLGSRLGENGPTIQRIDTNNEGQISFVYVPGTSPVERSNFMRPDSHVFVCEYPLHISTAMIASLDRALDNLHAHQHS